MKRRLFPTSEGLEAENVEWTYETFFIRPISSRSLRCASSHCVVLHVRLEVVSIIYCLEEVLQTKDYGQSAQVLIPLEQEEWGLGRAASALTIFRSHWVHDLTLADDRSLV